MNNKKLLKIISSKLESLDKQTLVLASGQEKSTWWLFDENAETIGKKIQAISGVPSTRYDGFMVIPGVVLKTIITTIITNDKHDSVAANLSSIFLDINEN